jgi:hypothetical protein
MITKWMSVAVMAGLAATLLSGCLIVDADVKTTIEDSAGFDKLLGVEISPSRPEITITAWSGGCTEKAHFATKLLHNNEGVSVGFIRKEQDRCKAFLPEGKRLTWTYAELGVPQGSTVRVLNPIGR